MNTQIQHHIKYKEIHGIDEIVLMNRSNHRKLHMRLRKEGKCNIPPKELREISIKARRRTDVMTRIVMLSLKDEDGRQLEELAKKKSLPLASMARSLLVEGLNEVVREVRP